MYANRQDDQGSREKGQESDDKMMSSAKKESGGIVEGLPSIPHLAAFQGREGGLRFNASCLEGWVKL